MALKMMSMNAMDKQFIDDNMLTDEDFRFDAAEEFEVTLEDQNILESFANGYQMMNANLLTTSNSRPVIEEITVCPDLNDLLKDMYDIEFKEEPPSPNSSDVSSEVYSTDNEVPVITIPKVSNDNEAIAMLNDTPPHTPCAAMDILPDSPGSCSAETIIVSVASLNGITYALPQNTQAAVNPVKYRVNIQPKIEPNTKVTKPVSMQTIIPKTSNKAILTHQQMEKLAKGTLQIRVPPNVAIPVPNGMHNAKTSHSLISKTSKNSSAKKNSTLTSLEICAAALKRQERIIKNRESAYLSRKRKKEYVQKLEAELNQITAENSSLREENCRLKLQISDLEKEILKLKSVFSPKTVKKTVGLMVVLFMLTFNLAPYSSFFEKTALKPIKPDVMSHRIGRVLLWNDGNSTEENNSSKLISRRRLHVPDEIKNSYIVNFEKSYNSSSCEHFINKTESLRLESDLLGWVERVEKKRKQTKMKKHKFHMENTLPHLASLSRRRAEINKDIWARRKNKNEILIYETPRQAYEDFFDAIHRRDDTFYFVSFSGDHLLLPAIAHNKTLRPRMSFVMPAMTLNESVGDSDEHISMMQIDCEVMDTKLVYIKESVIPEHLRQKQNNTTKPHSRNPEYSNDRPTRRIQSVNKLPQKSRTNG